MKRSVRTEKKTSDCFSAVYAFIYVTVFALLIILGAFTLMRVAGESSEDAVQYSTEGESV